MTNEVDEDLQACGLVVLIVRAADEHNKGHAETEILFMNSIFKIKLFSVRTRRICLTKTKILSPPGTAGNTSEQNATASHTNEATKRTRRTTTSKGYHDSRLSKGRGDYLEGDPVNDSLISSLFKCMRCVKRGIAIISEKSVNI